jgi:hypothetical protein
LDYAIKVEGKGFVEAVATLKGFSGKVPQKEPGRHEYGKFILPPKDRNNSRVISYLVNTRCIPYNILQTLIINERIYQAKGSQNCVFTGLDCNTGEARYAFERSSNPGSRVMFETRYSDKRFSFSLLGLSSELLVFESVVDLLSYMAMEPGVKRKDSFWLSLGGLSNASLDRFISKWAGLTELIFCLDSDSAADAAYERLGEQYASYGYRVLRHKPEYKDWNEQWKKNGYFFPTPPVPWEVTQ